MYSKYRTLQNQVLCEVGIKLLLQLHIQYFYNINHNSTLKFHFNEIKGNILIVNFHFSDNMS